jgi:signal transduction histidine kinase
MIRQPRSLARRLAWRLALVVIAAVALAAVAVGWRSVVAVRNLDDTALQDQARAIATHIAAGPDGRPKLDLPRALDDAFRSSHGDNIFLVTTESGAALFESGPDAQSVLSSLTPASPGLFRVAPSQRHPDGMVGYALRAGPWTVMVAQGREQSEVLVRGVLAELLSTGLALLAAIGTMAVLIGVWTVRQGLRPVRGASAAAAAIGPARPGARLPETDLPAEIAPLVSAINQALARLESALAAQRRFVGDAAHSLRTPLAVLMARIDALQDSTEAQHLRQDADRMARLVGQMLQMARIDGVPLDISERVDLHAVAMEAISALAPLAVARQLDLELTGAPAGPIRGNCAALVIALQNLIENALGHAPPGSTVQVELTPSNTLRVLDRGPGVSEAEQAAIFERFRRGRKPAGTAGAGLGLAIVAEIVAAHGGSAHVTAREGGGAAFELDLRGAALVAPLPVGDQGGNQSLTLSRGAYRFAGGKRGTAIPGESSSRPAGAEM